MPTSRSPPPCFKYNVEAERETIICPIVVVVVVVVVVESQIKFEFVDLFFFFYVLFDTQESSLVRKGLLWVMRDRMFCRWHERYCILTRNYLHCFKKATETSLTQMGNFLFKVSPHRLNQYSTALSQVASGGGAGVGATATATAIIIADASRSNFRWKATRGHG